jgi:hypothetical protein
MEFIFQWEKDTKINKITILCYWKIVSEREKRKQGRWVGRVGN